MQTLMLMVGGGLLLFVGAEALVRGGVDFARRLGVPAIVVGLTVVAYGTSLPELAVSAVAARGGNPEVAIGNVLGSNICNVALVLGIGVLVRPIHLHRSVVRREIPILLAVSLLFVWAILDGSVSRSEGFILLFCGPLITIDLIRRVRSGAVAADAVEDDAGIPAGSWLRDVGLMAAGTVALVYGGRWFVEGAVLLAEQFAIDSRVVGLTVVALGTSLPELVTVVVAQRRGAADLSVGNVVGSNIFNLSFVFGGAAAIHPMALDPAAIRLDLLLAILLPLAVLPYRRNHNWIGRPRGAMLVLGYLTWVAALARGNRF